MMNRMQNYIETHMCNLQQINFRRKCVLFMVDHTDDTHFKNLNA